MNEVSTVGFDLAKSVFQVHGSGPDGSVAFRKKLRRDQVLAFFAQLPRCIVAMEACASAHYWAREIAGVGHETRLITIKMGERSLRRLLILGASSAIKVAARNPDKAGAWLAACWRASRGCWSSSHSPRRWPGSSGR